MPEPTPVMPPADAAAAYRDALLRDASAEELALLAGTLDSDTVAWLDLFRAAQRERVTLNPAFAARLDRAVATAVGPPQVAAEQPPRPGFRLRRSHAVSLRHPVPMTAAVPGRGGHNPRLIVSHLATAVLAAAVLLAGLFAIGPLRPRPEGRMLIAPDIPIQLEPAWDAPGGGEPILGGYGVGVDPNGNIWVADQKDRFHIVTPDGTPVGVWGTLGNGKGEFDFRSRGATVIRDYGDIAFDAESNIYVADTGNTRIQKFAPDRTFMLAWGTKGEDDGQFLSPSGIIVAPDGTIYVSDEARADIQRFDRDGRFLSRFGEFGIREGQFISPASVAVAPNGTVYVADYGNSRIQYFTADGDLLGMWGKNGTAEGLFNKPNGVAVDGLGRVFVADDFNNRVQVFTADGQFLASAGEPGDGLGFLNDPLAVAVAPDGTAYVSDVDSVQAFRIRAQAADGEQ